MKTKYIILIVIILIIIIITLLYFFKFRKENVVVKEVEIKDVNSFYLSYSNGYAMNSNIRYELGLNKETNEYVAKIKPYEIPEEDKKEIVVDKNKMLELENLLKKHQVGKWNGFDKSDQGVLDGDSFSLSIMMDNGNRINASGYMMWPEGYRNFIADIDEFFMNIYGG